MDKSRDDLVCGLAHYRALLTSAANQSMIEILKTVIRETEEKAAKMPPDQLNPSAVMWNFLGANIALLSDVPGINEGGVACARPGD